MTPDQQIVSSLHRALAEEREVVVADTAGNAMRATVVEVDAERVRLLVAGDERPTSAIPIERLTRVRLLDVASSAARRTLALVRGQR